MPIFKVWAMDAEGANVTQFYEGDTSDAVIALARQRGLFPTKVKEVASAGNAPVERASSKRCSICGKDVSSEKRTKDTAGNYYCQPCYVSRSASNQSETSATASHAAASSGSSVGAAPCDSCGGQTELSPDKRRARCKDCGRVSVIGVQPSHEQATNAVAADANEARPSEQELFTCPICNESFNRNGMDESGVCKRCLSSQAAAFPLQATKCSSCGAAIDEDAAFCARCGVKQNDRMSPEDEVDVTSIIALLRQYAEASLALSGGEAAEKAFAEALIRGVVMENASEFDRAKRLHADSQMDGEQRERRLKQCRDIQGKLSAFDAKRVQFVKDLILQNDKVDESIKAGIRHDALGLFTATKPPSVTAANPKTTQRAGSAPTADGSDKRKPNEFMNGIWGKKKKGPLDNPKVGAALGVVGTIAAVLLGLYAWNGGGSSAASAALVIGFFAVLGTIAAVAEMRGKGWANQATTPQTSRRVPIGFCICVTFSLVGVLMVILAISLVVTGGPPSGDGIQSVLMLAGVGIVLLIVGGIGWSSSCPNCRLLGTSEILSSQNLGSHMETRKETRKARHYDATSSALRGETQYEVDVPVTVTTYQHLKHCKRCGHIWETTSRTES